MYRRVLRIFVARLNGRVICDFRVGLSVLLQVGVDHLGEDVADLGRRHEHGVHDDDDGERQRDGVGRIRLAVLLLLLLLTTSPRVGVGTAVASPAALELSTHAARVAHGAYQEEVGVGENGQRQNDADDQVQRVVGLIHGAVTL